jgi:hypothetical protein
MDINIRKGILTLVVVVGVGCSMHDERVYDSISGVARTADFSIIEKSGLPADAVEIRVRSDAETDHYYFSYSTKHPDYVVQKLGMAPVDLRVRERVRDSVGFGITLPDQVEIFRRCIVHPGAQDRDAPGRVEIAFIASADGRQYQWNQYYDLELNRILCGEEHGRVEVVA